MVLMHEPAERTLYRIVSPEAWRSAIHHGAFVGSEHDLRDGFIHLSTREQVEETAAKHYAGKDDQLLLFVREAELRALSEGALRWEPSRGGALFPHLYATLPVSLVHKVQRLPLGPDGRHQFPELEL